MTTGRRFVGTPLVLRFVLAAVFLWAGVPKAFMTMELSPEQAATLANIGAIDGPTPPSVTPDEAPPAPETPDAPVPTPPPAPEDAAPPAGGDGPVTLDGTAPGFALLNASTPTLPDADGVAGAISDAVEQVEPPRFVPGDFTEPVEVARYHGLIFLMNNLAQPKAADADGIQVLPTSLADNGQVLKLLAMAAAYTEFIAGVLLVLGFVTRLSALALAGTMTAAFWMTMAGPSIGTPDAFLGFLPTGITEPPGSPEHGRYSTLFLQLTTFACAFALVFIGAGVASLDAVLFGKKAPPPRDRSED